MFHRPSLLMTGIVLMMAVGWFAMQHYGVNPRAEAAEPPQAELAGERDIVEQ